MDFGRVDNIEGINLSLPNNHSSISKVLGGKPTDLIKFYCGCPIWTERNWVGSIYPSNAQPKDYLTHYAKQFNSIELNGTHYQIPDTRMLRNWRTSVDKDFRFCPKVHQSISHAKDLSKVGAMLKSFMDQMKALETNLAITFMQLAPYQSDKSFSQLIDLLDQQDQAIDLAIELRHETWFKDSKAFNDLCNYLYKKKWSLVITDTLGRRDVIHQRLINKSVFIRFTANNLHPTDYKRMDDWVERLFQWIQLGLESIYFFMHTPDKRLCTDLAIYFIQEVNTKMGLNIKAPILLDSGNRLL
jgi:uncharacterized protein YecE (DUF72 family)